MLLRDQHMGRPVDQTVRSTDQVPKMAARPV